MKPYVVITDWITSWRLNGKLHREDGPAVEYASGHKEWWLNGKYHRVDGPAIEYASGNKAWYLDGRFMSQEDHAEAVKATKK